MSFSLLLASLPRASVTDHRENVLQVFARRRFTGSVWNCFGKTKAIPQKELFFLF
jgi:hypothetical protein